MKASNVSTGGSREEGKTRSRLALIAAALVVGVGVGLLLGLLVFNDDDEEQAATAPPPAATLTRIVDNPDDFVGEPAFVSGEVKEIISPRAFTVTRPGLVGPELLVVSDEPLAAPTGRSGSRPILEGDLAQVSGEVREFDVEEFERDIGAELRREFDAFPRDDLGERRGDPAIRATTVTYTAGSTPVVEARTAEEVAERPRDFYGRIVSIEGEVTDITRSGALVIDNELLALTADFAQGRPDEGQRVTIVGPVRPFDPDQLRPGGRRLPDDELLGRFANRPAVVAQSIEVQS